MTGLLKKFDRIAQCFSIQDFLKNFELYNNKNRKFSIYLFKGNDEFEADDRIELAVLASISILHYHCLQDSYFRFPVTPVEPKLQRGVWELENGKKVAKIKSVVPRHDRNYLISKNLVHAAGPSVTGRRVPLLICNEVGMRTRNQTGYTDDTHFVDAVRFVPERKRYIGPSGPAAKH